MRLVKHYASPTLLGGVSESAGINRLGIENERVLQRKPSISSGHKPYAGSGDAPGVAWVRGDAGQPSSSEIQIPVCRPCTDKGKATSFPPPRQGEGGHGGVVEPGHVS